VEIRIPGDKSISHRALLMGALARGGSRFRGILAGADPAATAAILRTLGVPLGALPASGEELRVAGVGLRGLRQPGTVLDCMNSGTTARLLMGVLAGQPLDAVLTGDESLRRRPMGRVTGPLRQMGAQIKEAGGGEGLLPMRILGAPLRSIDHASPVASAQVKSALLLAGIVGGVPVAVTEPRRTRDHTERMLVRMGVGLEEGPTPEGGWRVALTSSPGSLNPLDMDIPGDPSSAAFFVALSLLTGIPVTLLGVGINPTRTGFLEVLRRMGARIEIEPEPSPEGGEPIASLHVHGGELRATDIGGDEIPGLIDELPILAIVAARAVGTTRITGAEELRVKESDRIRAMVEGFRAVGAQAGELPDGLEIEGSDRPLAGRVKTHMDHRIAMAFGVLGASHRSSIQIEAAAIADVSFPGFWKLLDEVGKAPAGVDAARPATPPVPAPSRDPETAPRSAPPTEAVTEPASPESREPASQEPPVAPVPIIVTLDGPAGSGKSTTAREVARRLGFRHLDSGSLYRGLTVGLLEAGVPESEWEELTREVLDLIPLTVETDDGGFRLRLADRLLDRELRDPQVTERVARLAGIPAVRAWLLRAQRNAATLGSLVVDGRDMGSVVFPEAQVKVFVTAELRERARRRLVEGGDAFPTDAEIDAEAERLEARDRQDRERTVSPLVRPVGSVDLDTTVLTFEEQVERIVQAVHALTR
jgi:3-phosphoshikimate 1-carboxyvinyltransferase